MQWAQQLLGALTWRTRMVVLAGVFTVLVVALFSSIGQSPGKWHAHYDDGTLGFTPGAWKREKLSAPAAEQRSTHPGQSDSASGPKGFPLAYMKGAKHMRDRQTALARMTEIMQLRGLGETPQLHTLLFHWDEDSKDSINRHGRYLFRREMTNRGFLEALDRYAPDVFFVFQGNPTHSHAFETKRFRPGKQLINHLRGEYSVYNKEHHIENVKEYCLQQGCTFGDIMPDTFFLHKTDECVELFSDRAIFADNHTLWFEKRCHFGSHGRGISVYHMTDLRTKHKIPDMPAPSASSEEWKMYSEVLQNRCEAIHQHRYKHLKRELMIQTGVEPLLLRNRKFDMRVYTLIANHDPVFMYHHDGYIRFGLREFRRNSSDARIHIGNHDSIKEDKAFNLREHYHSMPQMKQVMLEEGYTEADYELMANRVRRVAAAVGKALLPKMKRTNGHWLMLGTDFLIDSDLNPYLVEMNVNPELTLDQVRTEANRLLISTLLDQLLDVYEMSNRGRAPTVQEVRQRTRPGWDLLLTDATDPAWSILDGDCYAQPQRRNRRSASTVPKHHTSAIQVDGITGEEALDADEVERALTEVENEEEDD